MNRHNINPGRVCSSEGKCLIAVSIEGEQGQDGERPGVARTRRGTDIACSSQKRLPGGSGYELSSEA